MLHRRMRERALGRERHRLRSSTNKFSCCAPYWRRTILPRQWLRLGRGQWATSGHRSRAHLARV